MDLTKEQLERLPLRCIVALGYLAVRRVRGDFIVPAHVPNPRSLHKAVDKALEIAREFTADCVVDVKFALRAAQLADRAEQAGHDIIYGYGPYAGLGPVSVEHATQETRRAAVIADAAGATCAAVYHFSFSVLSEIDPRAVESIGFAVDQCAWAANGVRWTMETLMKCEPSLEDYARLLGVCDGKSHSPALGDPIRLESFHEASILG
jgi:hypothetical protein